MDVETGMAPRHDEFDHLFRDLPFLLEHLEHRMLKELFQGLCVQCRRDLERTASIESAVGAHHVAMGVEIQEIAEGLDCDDGPWISGFSGKTASERLLKTRPHAATQLGKESSVIEEVTPQDLWHAEGKVALRHDL